MSVINWIITIIVLLICSLSLYPIYKIVSGVSGTIGAIGSGITALKPECVIGPGGWGQCQPGYFCNGSKCVQATGTKNPGDPCAIDADCVSGKCVIDGINKCGDVTGKLPNGAYCVGDPTCKNRCLSGTMYLTPDKGNVCGNDPLIGTFADGTPCLDLPLSKQACKYCINPKQWWRNKTPNGWYCGNEPRIPDGQPCVAGSTCQLCAAGADYYSNLSTTTRLCGKLATIAKASGNCCWNAPGSNSGTACQYICPNGFHYDSNCAAGGSNRCN